MRILSFAFALFIAAVLQTSALQAQKRVALVVGIDTYDNLKADAQLRKAKSDASAVAQTFAELGFDVIRKHDLTRPAFNHAWQDFLNKLTVGDTAVFFFAGHGVELGGRNYLLPRDVPNVKPGRDELLKRESLSLQEFLADLREKGTRFNLVVLDACRDNPFEQVAGRSIGTSRGLAVSEPPEGTFIMFSAGTGETALDRIDDKDKNPNSLYTRQLIPLLKSRTLSLTDIAEQVRVDVRNVSATVQHRQTPAYYNQVLGRVCLASVDCPSLGRIDAAPPTQAQGEAERAWEVVHKSQSVEVLDAFAKQFPDTVYASLARERITELKRAEELATQDAETRRKATTRSTERAERQAGAKSADGERDNRGRLPSDLETHIARPDQRLLQLPVWRVPSPEGKSLASKALLPPLDDTQYPKARQRRKDAVAVIIGNSTYDNGVSIVDYGDRDAQAMKLIAMRTLGVDAGNILFLEDATRVAMDEVFGTETDYKGRLWRHVDPDGLSDVLIYFVGAAVGGGGVYLLPVDSNANIAGRNGYPLRQILVNLSKLKLKSASVFLDIPFFGTLNEQTLPPSKSHRGLSNISLFAATTDRQLSGRDTEAGHGIFTRYVLAGLAGEADTNKNREVTAKELHDYLGQRVRWRAMRAYGREQDPQFVGDSNLVLSSF